MKGSTMVEPLSPKKRFLVQLQEALSRLLRVSGLERLGIRVILDLSYEGAYRFGAENLEVRLDPVSGARDAEVLAE